jgi:hypothetical protein
MCCALSAFRLRRPLILHITAEDHIQGDATRAGVLAAHYLREVLKLHGYSYACERDGDKCIQRLFGYRSKPASPS